MTSEMILISKWHALTITVDELGHSVVYLMHTIEQVSAVAIYEMAQETQFPFTTINFNQNYR